MSSVPASARGLFATTPTGCAAEAREAADDVLRPELAGSRGTRRRRRRGHHVAHVVRLVRVVRDDRVELGILAVERVGRLEERRRLDVVLRQEGEEVARVLERRVLVAGGEVGDARLRRMRRGAAELLERHLLAGHRLHDLGAGDEHVRGLLDHEDEVGHRRRVDGAARAGPHDEADLGDDAGGLDVAPEDLRVAAERDDALLDARASRVVDPDQRAAVLEREVHDLADLLGEHLGERAAEDGEVLREDEDLAAEDRPVAGDDGVAPRPALHHPEVRVAVADEAVELDEAARVEQLLDPLAREELAALALPLDGAGSSPRVKRLVAEPRELVELALRRVGRTFRLRTIVRRGHRVSLLRQEEAIAPPTCGSGTGPRAICATSGPTVQSGWRVGDGIPSQGGGAGPAPPS